MNQALDHLSLNYVTTMQQFIHDTSSEMANQADSLLS